MTSLRTRIYDMVDIYVTNARGRELSIHEHISQVYHQGGPRGRTERVSNVVYAGRCRGNGV